MSYQDIMSKNNSHFVQICVTQCIAMNPQFGQKFKIAFLLYTEWLGCSFSSILVQKGVKSDIALLSNVDFIDNVITDLRKVDFEERRL